jgi:hypothetical protein
MGGIHSDTGVPETRVGHHTGHDRRTPIHADRVEHMDIDAATDAAPNVQVTVDDCASVARAHRRRNAGARRLRPRMVANIENMKIAVEIRFIAAAEDEDARFDEIGSVTVASCRRRAAAIRIHPR